MDSHVDSAFKESEIIENVSLLQSKHTPTTRKICAAIFGELIGTFLFLTCGMLVILSIKEDSVVRGGSPIPQFLTISLGFGALLFISIILFGPLSGAVFNPAVLVSLVLTKQVGLIQGACMFLAEVCGAIVASLVTLGLAGSPISFGTELSRQTSLAQGFFLETFGTFLLCTSVLLTLEDTRLSPFEGASVIGCSLTLGHMFGIFFTGASYNPVRAFGPAVASRIFRSAHWVYWLGPILGSLLATSVFLISRFLREGKIRSIS